MLIFEHSSKNNLIKYLKSVYFIKSETYVICCEEFFFIIIFENERADRQKKTVSQFHLNGVREAFHTGF